jgi:hypothetical protein
MKQIADAVGVEAYRRQRVEPRSGGRNQNPTREKLGIAGRAAPGGGK